MLRMPDHINVLLVGGGGREHALALALRRSRRLGRLWTTHPQHPGLGALARPTNIPYNLHELYRLEQFCRHERVHLVVVGPEEPLAAGMADKLSTGECLVFGPGSEAAKLESDKVWARQLMRSASIPMAEGHVFRRWLEREEIAEEHPAIQYLRSREEAPVVKPAGFTGGKGVVVPSSIAEAESTVRDLLVQPRESAIGDHFILEERLKGREVSVFALVDGRNIVILDACEDYKRLEDGDLGPNTGGMGAIAPSTLIDGPMIAQIQRQIIVPTIDALRREGIEYRGVLYCGLMLTHGGPRVLEFNARFGDPEAQVLLPRICADVLELLYAAAAGQLGEVDLDWNDLHTCCVVLASEGYPNSPRTGQVITGVEEASAMPDVDVLYAGAALDGAGRAVVSGGRVLNVVGRGPTADLARQHAYDACQRIHFDGMIMRRDIGLARQPVRR